MILEEFKEIFEAARKKENELVDNILKKDVKKTNYVDLHGLLLLEEILPADKFLILERADDDQLFLTTDVDELLKVITKEQIEELVGCGIYYDEETHSLFMLI